MIWEFYISAKKKQHDKDLNLEIDEMSMFSHSSPSSVVTDNLRLLSYLMALYSEILVH